MTDAIWDQFSLIPPAANIRLTVALESLAKRGDENVPGRGFRWVGKSSPPSPQLIEMEAHGVVLTGHASLIEGRQQFFVTEIIVDELEEQVSPPKRRRQASDDRQGKFKFERPSVGHSPAEGEPK
jgi:hypothetical protein